MSGAMVTQLKPNPAGKDRSRYGSPTIAQLGAEWVDIHNMFAHPVDLRGTVLCHLAYPAGSRQANWEVVVPLTQTLLPRATLRVHSGDIRNVSVLNPEDVRGAEYHAFTGRDAYVWNNVEGDSAGLWRPAEQEWVDCTSYAPNPPEGVVLIRFGGPLVPTAGTVFGRHA